jgi:hypothetical protein
VVDEEARRFAIVGQANGPAKTILDKLVSLNIVQPNGSFALDSLSEALTISSGTKVIVAAYPLNFFVHTMYTITAANQSAREVLLDMVDATTERSVDIAI